MGQSFWIHSGFWGYHWVGCPYCYSNKRTNALNKVINCNPHWYVNRNKLLNLSSRAPIMSIWLSAIFLTKAGSVTQVVPTTDGLTSYAGTTTTRHQLTCGEDPPHLVIREWRYSPRRLRVDDDDTLIIATWADRFSGCWWRFLQFLTCPITPPPVPASHCLSSLLHATAAAYRPPHKREQAEGHWVNKGHAKMLKLQQFNCHWGEVLTESRPRMCDISHRTLDALLDHLQG